MNQGIIRQGFDGLQRWLRQLWLEIDRKAEKSKEIVFNITTRREGPDPKLLSELDISATIVLMSLHELYEAL